jgi:hypothetical protein
MKTEDRPNNEVQMTIPSWRAEAKRRPIPRAFRAGFRRKYLIPRVSARIRAVLKK